MFDADCRCLCSAAVVRCSLLSSSQFVGWLVVVVVCLSVVGGVVVVSCVRLLVGVKNAAFAHVVCVCYF